MVTQHDPPIIDGLTSNQSVLLLHDVNLREEAMYQLIKKEDTCKDLALLLWNTFNAVYILLLEIISVYWKLSASMLSMRESTLACHALALFQVMANNPETRRDLIKAKIRCYFYQFLKPRGDDKPLESLRLTALGVLGSLTKFDDPYGSIVLHFFLESQVIPLCLGCMDQCDKPSRKVLGRVVEKLSQEPCLLHLAYVVQCYLSLSEILRFIGPCDAFRNQIPPQLLDNTFEHLLRVLHLNIYGCLHFPPTEDRKKIAEKATTNSRRRERERSELVLQEKMANNDLSREKNALTVQLLKARELLEPH